MRHRNFVNAKLSKEDFYKKYQGLLSAYWKSNRESLLSWKAKYDWPPGVGLTASLEHRANLQEAIRTDLTKHRYLSKSTFDDVMRWGFNGRPSRNSEDEIQRCTANAFTLLVGDRIAEAAETLLQMKGIGISRASKVLALHNQNDLGIYDHNSALALSDLGNDGTKLIPIPPSRSDSGDHRSSSGRCRDFERFVWVLRFFCSLALKEEVLCGKLGRVADIEIALFAKGRSLSTRAGP